MWDDLRERPTALVAAAWHAQRAAALAFASKLDVVEPLMVHKSWPELAALIPDI